jgi:type I restriction enzyme, R subunit
MWLAVQDLKNVDLTASRGVAIRNFSLTGGYGFADYLLYIDGKAAGIIEAKKEGATLTGVKIQTAKYREGLPQHLPAYVRPLPFLYQSTGIETRFTNRLDPAPRSRHVFCFHRPVTRSPSGFAETIANCHQFFMGRPLPPSKDPRRSGASSYTCLP